MTRIISIVNHKGGVGKTTSVASLGVSLADLGRRVLLVDLDPQCNLTDSLSVPRSGRTIYDSLREGRDLPQVEIRERLSVLGTLWSGEEGVPPPGSPLSFGL